MGIDKFGRFAKAKLAGERGPPGIGFTVTKTGDYNMNFKKLQNVGKPENGDDAVTKNIFDDMQANLEALTHILAKDRVKLNQKMEEYETAMEKYGTGISDLYEKLNSIEITRSGGKIVEVKSQINQDK